MIQPTLSQRLIACRNPENRQHVMYQKWRDLLFAHWEFESDQIQKTLPKGLFVDTYQNKAYLGVVPFFMKDIRPRFFPTLPGVSNFLEMNLRTYVYDRHGRPGVWFYSLDANQWLAVRAARTLFNLPYFDAKMRAKVDSVVDYRVSRKGSSEALETHFRYSALEEIIPPEPESLEFFLIERYYLFAANRVGSIFSGRVHHRPYPLRNVAVEVVKEGAIASAGFERPFRQPDHVVMSHGVDVKIFPLEGVD